MITAGYSTVRTLWVTMAGSTTVGVDGTLDGWLGIRYRSKAFQDVRFYRDATELWADNEEAATVLVDVPIGLASDRAVREPERCARARLGPRHGSVFNVPIRGILDINGYDEANEAQRSAIDKGLQQQTHHIAPKIREVDNLLSEGFDPGQDTIRESHPELCFWALNGGKPMSYSKSGQPAAAFWERASVLEDVDDGFREALFRAGETIARWDAPACSNDDLIDAFALAITGSDLTGPLQTLPEEPRRDDVGLRMEMVFAEP